MIKSSFFLIASWVIILVAKKSGLDEKALLLSLKTYINAPRDIIEKAFSYEDIQLIERFVNNYLDNPVIGVIQDKIRQALNPTALPREKLYYISEHYMDATTSNHRKYLTEVEIEDYEHVMNNVLRHSALKMIYEWAKKIKFKYADTKTNLN